MGWGVEWIRLAQDRDRWRAVVNAVMNVQVLAPWSFSCRTYVFYECEEKLFKKVLYRGMKSCYQNTRFCKLI
jgi:hypothetical protein